MNTHESCQTMTQGIPSAAFARLSLAAGLGLSILLGACSPLQRSRALDNPDVPATTIALQVCSNCHGVGGVSVSPNFPNLAAQTPAYLEAQLKGFKSHGRRDPAGFEYMWGISARLSDAQIAGLAEYFSAQRATQRYAHQGPADAGGAIFSNGIPAQNIPACASCHGAKGEGNGMFPRLAGQHADYVVKQLIVFQRTDERPEGSVMKTIAHSLTPENIDGIAAYVQSIPPAQ
jgi:cytochrome c553